MGDFVSFRVLLRGENARERSERLVAETWDAGASGHEESLDEASERVVVIYSPTPVSDAVLLAARQVTDENDEVSLPTPVEAVDWTKAWSKGLVAIEVSDRLIVRPSTVACDLRPQQLELVIDPGLAFGTGSHASTRLCLDWICHLASSSDCIGPATRVLDVGTGTGLLALAALRLGAGYAVGFDIDPLAPPEARRWARHNSLADHFRAFTGPVEALAGPAFDLVLANLLRSEMLPIAREVCERVAPEGRLVLSGLLMSDRDPVESAMSGLGFAVLGQKEHRDETGDHWISLLLGRDGAKVAGRIPVS